MEPIPLTDDQINNILADVPPPPGVGRTAIRIAQKHFIDQLKTVLRQIKLYPIEEAFNEFKEEIIRSIYESHIEPGRAVGVTASVSLGGPITQLSLNSFHFAGAQSGVAQAFQKVRNFLTGSRINRDPQMKIYFKQSGNDLHDVIHTGTFESIIAKRLEFEQTTVQDVVVDNQIFERSDAEMAGVPAMIELHAKIRPERFANYQERFNLDHVVELKLNTYRMYTHRITMQMLCTAIEGPELLDAPPDALTCVWRSQFDGLMYILVDSTKDYSQQAISQSAAILMFLHRYVIRQFDIWKISGITNIISIQPRDVDVLRGIYRVRRSASNPNAHYVFTNNHRTRWNGVSLGDIRNLLEVAGFQPDPITDRHKEGLYIKAYYNGNLMDALEEQVTMARSKSKGEIEFTSEEDDVRRKIRDGVQLTPEEEAIRVQLDQKLELTPEEQRILGASTYWYMLTKGNNMNDIIWRDDIDLFRTISNDSHEIVDTLGIDAARIFLIFRFRQTLEDFSSYVNGRNISLIFDLLTTLGIINSLSYTGINRRRAGPLTTATVERTTEVFMNAAASGDKQAIVGVSPAIYVGQRSKRVGTGSIALEEDLTAIPQDRPAMPSIDEETILTDADIPIEFTSRNGQLAQRFFGEPTPQAPLPGGPVNKTHPTTQIRDVGPPSTADMLPSGALVYQPPKALMSALTKLTTNTPLEVAPSHEPVQADDPTPIVDVPDVPDITELDDITGLELVIPQRFIPASSDVPTDIFTQMRQVPTTTLPEQNVTGSKLPPSVTIERVPTQREAPDTRVLGAPLSPRGRRMIPFTPQPVPISEIEEEIVTRDQPGGSVSPSSFIDLLPDLSAVTLPTSERGDVQGISIREFTEKLRTTQQ